MVSFDSTDLDNATTESGVVHQSTANTDHNDASELKQGYDYANFSEITPNPVACYPLHEDSGTTAYDVAGANNGVVQGGVTLGQSGLLGTTAPDFGGSDGEIDTGIETNYQTGDFAVSAWINPDTGGGGGGRIVVDDSNGNGWALSYGDPGDNRIRFFVRGMDTISLDTAAVVPAGEWSLITGVFDNTNNNRYIYVNGSMEASLTSDSGTPTTDAGSVFIGGSGGNYFDGRITDARLYTSVASASQHQTLYDVVATSGSLTTQYKPI